MSAYKKKQTTIGNSSAWKNVSVFEIPTSRVAIAADRYVQKKVGARHITLVVSKPNVTEVLRSCERVADAGQLLHGDAVHPSHRCRALTWEQVAAGDEKT